MNMSQLDQVELWRSVLNGDLETYLRVSSKLKLGIVGDDFWVNLSSSSLRSRQSALETNTTGPVKTGRVPVRLYVWEVTEDFDCLEEAPSIDSWDKISYINRPVEINEEDRYFTLGDAVRSLLPEFFVDKSLINDDIPAEEVDDDQRVESEDATNTGVTEVAEANAEIKLLRIQGIEPKLGLPFSWVVNNMMNPEHFLHICVYLKATEPVII